MKIKILRQDANLTQKELSEATKIPRWKIQLIEINHIKPSKKELAKLAKYLNFSIKEYNDA